MLKRIPFLIFALSIASCVSPSRERRNLSNWDAARSAWQRISNEDESATTFQAYREATSKVVAELVAHAAPAKWPASLKLSDGHIVHIDAGRTRQSWQPGLFDGLTIAKPSRPIPVAKARRDGLGVPMDGVRDHDSHDRDASFVYSKGQHLAVTAVLEFGKDPSNATLHLYDPREITSVSVGGNRVALAADLATPVQKVLDKRSFVRQALGGLLRPGRFESEQKLFFQEPYRSDKVPVVLVHGLMSDPHIWENMVVALMSDPFIGPRVQCWCYLYPTGLPIASSAAGLRKRLKQADGLYGPGKGTDGAILIGHSMGGLLSRMQVIDSSEAFWNTWFKLPPEKVPLDGESSRRLRSALLFDRNKDIDRVVFIATPHRGADMADGWIGRVGSMLIHTPQSILQLATSVATLDVELLNPERLSLRNLGVTSVSNLSTKHPIIQALNSQPIQAPCHSIIGVVNSKTPLEESSDGFVPYRSSHLECARSEDCIHAGHSCTDNSETVSEVLRIVREQLQHRSSHR